MDKDSAISCSVIALAGPPGSGKSTVATLLAERTGWKLIELDRYISESEEHKIPDLFRIHGENIFRKLEQKYLYEVMKFTNIIVSLGGGCLLDEKSREYVLDKAFVITLTAEYDILYRRCLEKKNRPLIKNRKSLIQLLQKRHSHYSSLPNCMDTSSLSPEEVADRIMKLLPVNFL